MTEINIKENDHFFVNGLPLIGGFVLDNAEVLQICGENGVGKSSLLQFLLLHKEQYFGEKRPYFLNQLRLTPLNLVSFNDLKQILESERYEILPEFDMIAKEISDFANTPIKNLSGGQNQLIKIALMLFLSGEIFFLDEPFQYLDQKKQKLILDLLKDLKSKNKSLIIIEHQISLFELVTRKMELKKNGDSLVLEDV